MLSSLLRNHLLSFRPELTRAPPATVGGLGPCRRWRNSNADTGSGVVSRYRKPTQGNHYLPTAIYGHSWRPQFVGDERNCRRFLKAVPTCVPNCGHQGSKVLTDNGIMLSIR